MPMPVRSGGRGVSSNRGVLLGLVVAVAAVVALVALVVAGDRLWSRGGGGPRPLPAEELEADPVFDIPLEGAEPGPLRGSTGEGSESGAQGRPDSVAWRTWTSDRDRDDLLLEAVADLRAVGAEVDRLTCHRGLSATFRGYKQLDTGEFATLEVTFEERSDVLTVLMGIGEFPPTEDSPPTSRPEDGPPVTGDCPARLVDAL